MLNVENFTLKSIIALDVMAEKTESSDSEMYEAIRRSIQTELAKLDLTNLTKKDLELLAFRSNVFIGKPNSHIGIKLEEQIEEYLEHRFEAQQKKITLMLNRAENALEEFMEYGETEEDAYQLVIETELDADYDNASLQVARQRFAGKHGK